MSVLLKHDLDKEMFYEILCNKTQISIINIYIVSAKRNDFNHVRRTLPLKTIDINSKVGTLREYHSSVRPSV